MSRESQRAERTKRAAKRRARKQRAKVLLSKAADADAILAAEKARAEKRIADAQAKLDGLRADLNETGQAVEQKAATVWSLTNELAGAKEELLEERIQHAGEKAAHATANQEIRELEESLALVRDANRELQEKLSRAERTITDLHAQDMESAPLRRRLRERAAEVETLRTQLCQARAQIAPRPLVLGVTP